MNNLYDCHDHSIDNHMYIFHLFKIFIIISISEGCLACITAYLVYLCTETHYEKVKSLYEIQIQFDFEWFEKILLTLVFFVRFSFGSTYYFPNIFFVFINSVSEKCPNILLNRMNEFIIQRAYKLRIQLIVAYV